MSGNYPPQGPGYPGAPQGPGYPAAPQGPGYPGTTPQPNFGAGGFDEAPQPPSGPNQYGQYGDQGGLPTGPGTPSGNPHMTYTGAESMSGASPYSATTAFTTPPTTPPPAKKKSNVGIIAIICSVAAVVVIGAIILGIVLTRGAGAKTPTQVVQAYFDALIANDAAAALSFAMVEPTDKSFLTNEALTASSQLAAISNVKVAEVTDKYAYEVAVSYTLGEQNVNVDIRVDKSGNDWKLDAVASEVKLDRLGIMPLINGTKANANTVFLFPGTYKVTSGNKYVDFAEAKNTLSIIEPSEFGSSSAVADLDLQLLAEGKTAMLTAAQESLATCLAKKELAPEGCPFYARPNLENGAVQLDMSTFKFTASGELVKDANPRLEFDNPLVAQFSWYPTGIRYYVQGIKNGGRGNFDYSVTPAEANTAQMDFSKETPVFSWVA